MVNFRQKQRGETPQEATQSKKMVLGMVGVIGILVLVFIFSINNTNQDIIMNYQGDGVDRIFDDTLIERVLWSGSNLNDNLTAYYKMDIGTGSNVLDSIDGTANGTLFDGGWNGGILENATNYSSTSSSYVSIPSSDEFNFGNDSINNNGTISMWVYPNKAVGAWTFIQKRQGASGAEPGIRILTDDSTHVKIGFSNGQSIAVPEFSAENWYHVVMRRLGDNVSLWINGSIVGSVTDAGNATNNNNTVIGGHGVGDSDAKIDEVGVWNRGLSDLEIFELYNNNLSRTLPASPNLISLDSPPDWFNTTQNTITFQCSFNITDGDSGVNTSLYTNSTGTWQKEETKESTGTTNTTTFQLNVPYSEFVWTCNVDDDGGERGFGTNRTINVSGIIITSETFTTPTSSGIINPFIINITTNGTPITIARLSYNGTSSLATITSNGNNYTLTKNQIAPGVSTTANLSFFWNITMGDEFNFLTPTKNQTVSPIVVNETCIGMTSIVNFTMRDEINQLLLTPTTYNTSMKIDLDLYTSDRSTKLVDYFNEFSRINPAAICIDNDLGGGDTYSLDLQVEYNSLNHTSEFYNIEMLNLNSSTIGQNISLYNLDTTNAQEFRLRVRDTSYLPIDGALVRIERKYIENGTFFVTEIPKADEGGITSASLQTNDVIYNFYIYEEGELISSFTNVLAICQTPLVSQCEIDFNSFQSEIIIPDYEEGNDFNFTIDYNSTSKEISSDFVIPSGEPTLVELIITSEDSLGTSVCSDSITSASGTLSCTVPNSFGNATVMAKLYKAGEEEGKGSISTKQSSSEIFGVVLVMLSVLVMLTLVGVGISDNPVVTAVFLFVGVALLFGINLVQNNGFVGATATILFFAIAIILVIIKAARRS